MTKTKSRHHKNENDHRFLTLSERLANIKVDVVRKVNRYTEKPEETETYFYRSLEKWNDLNYSANFYEFTIKVKSKCQTLAQLLFNKDFLVECLNEYISKGDNLSLQPVLDLTVQLSRDLLNDFYPHFPIIFKTITKLLATQDTDIIEWCFQTLSYLFKFLWRYMLKDLNTIYELYSPLFESTNKEYIRNFAAESFAFLMRKITDKNHVYEFLFNRLIEHRSELDGVARLIFEMFKGIKHQFNTGMEHGLAVLLDKLDDVNFECIAKTVESMAEYTKKQYTQSVWKCFYTAIDKYIKDKSKLVLISELIQIFLEKNSCYLVDNLDLLLENVCKIGSVDVSDEANELNVKLTDCFMRLVQTILLSENVKFSIEKSNILPRKLFETKFNCDSICKLTKELYDYDLFDSLIMPNLINYFDSHLSKPSDEYKFEKAFIDLLSEYLIRTKRIIEVDGLVANTDADETNEEKSDSSSTSFFKQLISSKQLSQFNRLFNEKRFLNSKLYTQLIAFVQTYLANMNKEISLCKSVKKLEYGTLIEYFVVAPFLFQTNEKLNQQIVELNRNLLVRLNKDLDDLTSDARIAELADSIELSSFLLSLNIWSLLMLTHMKSFFADSKQTIKEESCFHRILDILKKCDNLEQLTKSESHRRFRNTMDKLVNNLLRSLTYYTSATHHLSLSIQEIQDVLPLLKLQLSSPFHENRLNSLKILNHFCPKYEQKTTDDQEDTSNTVQYKSLFEICIQAEVTPASLNDYRQKVYYLQLLDPNACAKYLSVCENLYQDVPLRYLIGVLYENFKLIWDPTIELIKSYANFMKINEFWAVFGDYLSLLSDRIELKMNQEKSTTNSQYEIENHLSHLTLNDQHNIDHMNNRYLLCKAMQGFSGNCEAKTRIIVPIFFRFMNNEYYAEENRLLSTAYDDLTIKKEKDRSQKTTKYVNKALLNKHLCGYLDIFSQFRAPKSWFQEEALRSLYLNLLCHYDSSVQKSALACLYPYNYPYLMPYKEHFEKLLEGKHFRHELVVFSLEESTGVVHIDHRKNLLPILMRILYGKFHSHETTHTASRDTKTNKRSTIIQFLSSCNEFELNYFFNLIFDSLNSFLLTLNESGKVLTEERFEYNDNDYELSQRDAQLAKLQSKLNDPSVYDLKRVIPFKKILGILQSLDIIIKKLARQIEHFAHRILQFICFIHKYAKMLTDRLGEKNMSSEYHSNLLKIIRQQVTLRFKQFFDTFDHLDFTQQEYFFIYESFIWPQSTRLSLDCVKNVNNLLKIFLLWSERPNYYPLFVLKLDDFKQIDKNSIQHESVEQFKTENILDLVFKLIDSSKCSQNVVDFVLDIVHNLVSYADFKMSDQIDVDDELVCKPLPFQIESSSVDIRSSTEELNFGTLILKPHVSSIVNHIERKVLANMGKKELPTKPLKILARISCFASNSQQQCEKIIQLLIPYLIKNRKQTEDSEMNILNSINYLLRQVTNLDDFVCPLSRLFCVIANRQSRIELCNIFKTLKELDKKYETLAQLVNDLNSWDAKRLEEPDYMLRLEAFKQLNTLVREWTTFDIQLASILIYNCFFFINNIGDLAIKESSTNCVQLFLKKSSELTLSKSERHLFETNFVAEMKKGLRSKVESARHEFVNVLVAFLKSFKHIFTQYNDLCVLFDESDVEKDFYENIKHIQMHRRARALKRLQRACNDKQIAAENLLNFMIPLVRCFLDTEVYYKYDYLIEDACQTLGSICTMLSWPKYLKLTQHYLKELPKSVDNQKIVIKILVNVLDAFHFDLSLATSNDYFTKNKQVEEEEEEEEEQDESMKQEVNTNNELQSSSVNKKQVVSASLANKIHSTITKSILPTLFKCLTKRFKSDEQHKLNKYEDYDEQVLRVPIALAILKLLNNLPKKTFETHLPGLLFKVCDMLKSRAISVRTTTRECLMKMVNSFPSKQYYFHLFKELSNSLTRGYQVHVLCYTIQMVLKNIEANLVVGDLDASLDVLLSSVKLELFSDVSDEKEVKQILAKITEAKVISSFNTLETLAKFLSQSRLLDLLKPFKEELDTCNSRKLLKKIEEALRRILLGLMSNTSLTAHSLLILVYGLVNDTFSALKHGKRNAFKQQSDKEPTKQVEMQSCLIIQSEAKRGGDKPKVQSRTNQHVIVEFALNLLNNLIKQNRLAEVTDFVKMLDPYLQVFVEYLDGKYLKVTIITIRCLIGMLKHPLPSLEVYSKQIANKLFVLLRTYSSSSTNESERGDNFELLMVCYKLISNLIRDCAHFNLNDEQLQVLLHYAERNLYDNYKQASAFNLLKSILSRKFQCEELNDVLGKVMKLSIQAESVTVRLQSRQTMLQYMLNYALTEKKLIKLIEFYVVQLDYEYESGRESALEMLATMFETFPTSQLNTHASLFFLPLAIQLHNDESSKCKKLAWLALKSLLEKVSVEQRDALFAIIIALFEENDKALYKRIGALVVKIFVEVESSQFERRLDTILNILSKELDVKNFEQSIESETTALVSEKFYDHYLHNLLGLFLKVLSECKVVNEKKYSNIINQIFDNVKEYLIHEHQWVRLISCQLFGLLFSNFTVEELVKNKTSYFNHSTSHVFLKIRDLIDAFVIQLKSPILENDLAEQIVKNLAFMAKLLKTYDYNNESGEIESLKHNINIEWLIKKVIKEANYELVNKPKETIKRSYIFKWLAALTLELGKEKMRDYLNLIIPCLQREIVIGETDETLKRLAQEVLDFIKQAIGVEEFSMIYSKFNKRRTEFREERKRKLAQTAVTDPQVAALKKIRKMQKKKEAKKRKLEKNPMKKSLNKAKKLKMLSQNDDF